MITSGLLASAHLREVHRRDTAAVFSRLIEDDVIFAVLDLFYSEQLRTLVSFALLYLLQINSAGATALSVVQCTLKIQMHIKL